nr:MFS transporter [Roseococcus sp. MDT2-1-1]
MAGFGAIYSYAVFADALAAEFAVSPASLSVIYSLSGGSCFLVSAVSGPIADRIGSRVPAGFGMALVAAGLFLAATATSLAEVYLGYGLLIGLGTGFAYVPAMAAVQRRFDSNRGLASGLAVSGIGAGAALVAFSADALFSVAEWRASFVAFGLCVGAVGFGGALLLEPGRGGSAAARSAPAAGSPVPGFAWMWAGIFLVSTPSVLPHALLVGTALDLGLPRTSAFGLLGLIGIGTIAGRFLLAVLADAVGRRGVFLVCCAGMAGSMAVWGFARDEATLQVFALGFGALQGGFVALLPAFVADSVGAQRLGRALGFLYTSRGVALVAAAPAVAGAAAASGHTIPVLAVAAMGGLGALLLAWKARPAGAVFAGGPAFALAVTGGERA